MTRAHIITAQNVNYAFNDALWWLRVAGVDETSRNGPVKVAPGPVITQYIHPQQRVLFNEERDANPVFHLVEAIWMLAGQNDVRMLEPYNANMRNYAEDDCTIHGAYGYRWRNHWDYDQLGALVHLLHTKPDTRQAVLQMWDISSDLGAAKKDIPCNTHIYFDRRGGKLNMTVCCRSNDMIWGAYGANVVHFSFLQEWLAAALDIPMGTYTQISNNFHVYTKNEVARRCFTSFPDSPGDYPKVIPLVNQYSGTAAMFLKDCEDFFGPPPPHGFRSYFIREVAAPLAACYLARKLGQDYTSMLGLVPDCDWKIAFRQWCARREDRD